MAYLIHKDKIVYVIIYSWPIIYVRIDMLVALFLLCLGGTRIIVREFVDTVWLELIVTTMHIKIMNDSSSK